MGVPYGAAACAPLSQLFLLPFLLLPVLSRLRLRPTGARGRAEPSQSRTGREGAQLAQVEQRADDGPSRGATAAHLRAGKELGKTREAGMKLLAQACWVEWDGRVRAAQRAHSVSRWVTPRHTRHHTTPRHTRHHTPTWQLKMKAAEPSVGHSREMSMSKSES